MQLISEKIGHAIGILPNRIDSAAGALSLGIEFVGVAESHVLLFSRLKHYVHGESEEDGDDFVEGARQCELGVWLHGEGLKRFGHLQTFWHLRDIHEKFHDEAEAVLCHLGAGSWVAAEQMCKREFSQSLRRILIALTELNEAIKKAGSGDQMNELANCDA